MKQRSYNLKSNVAYLANLVDGYRALSMLGMMGGNFYWCDPTNGSNTSGDGSEDRPVADIPTAYALCTSGNHDVVVYKAGTTAMYLSEALTWAKHYTHLIGLCAPTGIGQRARIFQLDTASGLSPLINITATGCIFSNIYVFHGVDDATSLINVQVTGARNYFENVHFAGGGHDTMAIDNCASLFLNGGSENKFVGCTFGVDTIKLATGGNVLRFDGLAARNQFQDCLINTLIDDAGARLVELVDSSSLLMITFFRNCLFISDSDNKGTPMASAFEIPVGHSTTATIYLDSQCSGLGFTDWDDDNRGIIYMDKGTQTAGGNSGIALVSTSA